jgi:hypothetical protein
MGRCANGIAPVMQGIEYRHESIACAGKILCRGDTESDIDDSLLFRITIGRLDGRLDGRRMQIKSAKKTIVMIAPGQTFAAGDEDIRQTVAPRQLD